MNKKIWIFILIAAILIVGIGFFIYFNNSNKNNTSDNENNYQANRTSTSSNNNNNSEKDNTNNNNDDEKEKSKPKEIQLSTFSTKIYSSDPARQDNIELTCQRLNGTIVKDKDTFSFYAVLGPSTQDKGYQEADILDQYGNKQKGVGGRKLSNQFNII